MRKLTLILLVGLFSLSFLNFVRAEDDDNTVTQYPEFTQPDND